MEVNQKLINKIFPDDNLVLDKNCVDSSANTEYEENNEENN